MIRRVPAILYMANVFRLISTSVLSFLLLLTLVWGGCISCPQFFMFPAAAKNCCNKAGQCERPTQTAPLKDCKRIPLTAQGHLHAHLALAAAVLAESAFTIAPTPQADSMMFHPEPAAVDHSPPDLQVLHSNFLI